MDTHTVYTASWVYRQQNQLRLSRFMVHCASLMGGTTHGPCTVHRHAGPPAGVPGCDQPDPRRVSAARPTLRGGVPSAYGSVAPRWQTPGRPPQCSVYKNCPLPTPEDRLLFILAYVKTYSLHVVQGRLFGMGQSKANQWIHVLLPVLLAALRALGDAPARSLTALAQRLGVSEIDVATVVAPLEEASAPVVARPGAVPASPLLPMTGRNGGSSAPKTLLNRRGVIAARKKTTR